MADDAQPSADQNSQKRETLRVQLPPRPLKPDSTQLSRPNAGTAATIPMKASDQLTPGGTSLPPWSTAVTQPMQRATRPPTGLVGPAPSQIKQSTSLTGSRAKTEPLVLPTPPSPRPAAPPITGVPGRKTAPLRTTFSSAPPLTGLVPAKISAEPTPAPQPNVPPPLASMPPGTGRVAPPRVIIANPQAKVFVSGKTDQLAEIAPIEHRARPPALPTTGTLPVITKDTVGMPKKSFSNLADTAPTPIPSAPSAEGSAKLPRVPEPLAPQPPLIPATGFPSLAATETFPPIKVAPPLEVTPSGSSNIPLPVAKSSPILAPSIRPPAFPVAPPPLASVPPSVPPPLAPTIPLSPVTAPPLAPTLSLKPEPPSLAPLPNFSGTIPRRTTSTVPPVVPPMASSTSSLPLLPSKTAAISTSDAGLQKPVTAVRPPAPIQRQEPAAPLPPSGFKLAAPIVADPSKKSNPIIPPVEPILRKSARLFQPPLPVGSSRSQTQVLSAPPQPVVVSTPPVPPVVPSVSLPSPVVPPPVVPALPVASSVIPVVRPPTSVAPVPVPPGPLAPAKRSSRIILANNLEREAAPFPKTPPPMMVVPPVSASQRLLPAAATPTVVTPTIVTGTVAAIGAVLAAEAVRKPEAPTVMEESNTPSTPPVAPPIVPPVAITPRSSGVIAPPPVKPLTSRIDAPVPRPPMPPPASLPLQAATIAPPRRTQSVPQPELLRAGSPPPPPPAIRPVMPVVAANVAATPPPPPTVKPVLPSSSAPATPPPAPAVAASPGVAPTGPTVKPIVPSSPIPAIPPPAPAVASAGVAPTVPTIKPVIPVSSAGAPPTVRPVVPVPVGAAPSVKPVIPGATPAVAPVTPAPAPVIKPKVPGVAAAVTPVKPVMPGAVVVPMPPAPGTPLKPAASVPAPVSKSDGRTGTTAVKTPPPKETARITVKPSLPSAGPRPAVAGAPPTVKPVVGATVAGAAAAGAIAAGSVAASTPAVAKKPDVVPVGGIPIFSDERSTLLTTVLSGVLALVTWSTAVLLFLSYKQVI